MGSEPHVGVIGAGAWGTTLAILANRAGSRATLWTRNYQVMDSIRERRENAAKYLTAPELELSQIARMLGYAEQSAFTRSCRRWFGMTPREFRAEVAEQ